MRARTRQGLSPKGSRRGRRGRALAGAALVASLSVACEGALVEESADRRRDAGAGGEAAASAPGEATGERTVGSGGAPAAAVWRPVETDWCSEGWVGLDDRTCFHVPKTAARDAPIVFVLHGAMAPDTLPGAMQSLAAEAADALGFVAVFPRGEQGLCLWDRSVALHFCWPTRRETVDAAAPQLLEAWMRHEARLAEVLGATFSRRYVMGFSSGGYFASYVALEGLIDVAGAGIVGAGRSVIEAELFSLRRPPIYLAVGEDETAGVIASAENLDLALGDLGWKHALIVHPARGHEIHEDDFEAAWAIWAAP